MTNSNGLYLHFCNIYGYQTWQSRNLRWGDPIFKVTWTFDYAVTWQIKRTYIYTAAIPMAIKLGRVITYGKKTPQTKSRYPLIKCCRDKCKTLYLHFHNIYGHQTWQRGNLWWRDPNFKVMWPFDYVVTWQMKKILYLSFLNTYGHETRKSDTYGLKIPHIKLHDPLITWSSEKYKTLYLYFCSTYDHKTGQSSNLQWRQSTFKVTWLCDYLFTWQMKKITFALAQYLWSPNVGE